MKYSVSGWSSVSSGPVPVKALTWLLVSRTLSWIFDTHCAVEMAGKSGAPARSARAAGVPKTAWSAAVLKVIGAWEPIMYMPPGWLWGS
jgi:hypothetical protein